MTIEFITEKLDDNGISIDIDNFSLNRNILLMTNENYSKLYYAISSENNKYSGIIENENIIKTIFNLCLWVDGEIDDITECL